MTQIASTELQASPPSAAWLRILALVYDPFLWLGEIAGMRRRRSTLLGGAPVIGSDMGPDNGYSSPRTLVRNSGSGPPLYPAAVPTERN